MALEERREGRKGKKWKEREEEMEGGREANAELACPPSGDAYYSWSGRLFVMTQLRQGPHTFHVSVCRGWDGAGLSTRVVGIGP